MKKALTLWPEWLPTFTTLNKRVENRSWAPPDRLIGERFALHAGAHVGGGSWKKAEWCELTAEDAGWEVTLGRNRLGEYDLPQCRYRRYGADSGETEPVHLSAIVATARLGGFDRGPADPEKWAMPDAVHWRLDELRRVVEPVPCVGHQGLWNVPEDVLRDVLAREVAL